jgi:hypothetical protein
MRHQKRFGKDWISSRIWTEMIEKIRIENKI